MLALQKEGATREKGLLGRFARLTEEEALPKEKAMAHLYVLRRTDGELLILPAAMTLPRALRPCVAERLIPWRWWLCCLGCARSCPWCSSAWHCN